MAEGEPSAVRKHRAAPLASLVYGLRADGRLVHVGEVQSGLQPDLVCPTPGCASLLVAHKGEILADHFAHYEKTDCPGVGETTAHALAKDILQRSLKLWLPEISDEHRGHTMVRRSADYLEFESARLEHRLDGLVPDVILTHKGRELVVEIKVTHACGPEKIRRLRAADLPTVEIDLSGYRSCTDDEIADAVVLTAPRAWLYNKKIDEIPALIEARLEEQRALAKQKAEADADRLLKASFSVRSRPESLATIETLRQLGRLNMVGLVSSRFPVFKIPDREWQALIYERFVVRATGSGWYETFAYEEACELLLELKVIQGPFARLRHELASALRARRPDFRTPEDLVRAYLDELCSWGPLSEWDGRLKVEQSEIRALRELRLDREQQKARAETGLRRVCDLVRSLAPDEALKFDPEVWKRTALPHYDCSFDEIAQRGGQLWDRFDAGLNDLARLAWSDRTIPTDLLGLPLDAYVTSLREQKKVREAEAAAKQVAEQKAAADGRLQAITTAAYAVFEPTRAALWLAEDDGENPSPAAAALSDDAGLVAAVKRLEPFRLEAEERKRREAMAAEVRDTLRQAAEKAFSERRLRELWLNTTQPALGAPPIEYCVDHLRLRSCMGLLPRSRRRRAA